MKTAGKVVYNFTVAYVVSFVAVAGSMLAANKLINKITFKQ